LFEFCQIYAGGTLGNVKITEGLRLLSILRTL
jgi:hypothetical protein